MGSIGSRIVLTLAVCLLAGCERAKTKLDREVDRLCAIDGGMHIYETVVLAKENFGPDGEVFPQFRHLFKQGEHLGQDFIETSTYQVLVDGDPKLSRTEQIIRRRADGKVLGSLVVYTRFGGDLPGPWEPSSKSCPERAADLVKVLFIQEGIK